MKVKGRERNREGERFACLWRIKGEHSLNRGQKILRNLSMLIYSNDCSGKRYKISSQGCLNELWMYFWDTWFHFFSQNCVMHLYAKPLSIQRTRQRFTTFCCLRKDQYRTFLTLERQSSTQAKSGVSKESHRRPQGLLAHWHNGQRDRSPSKRRSSKTRGPDIIGQVRLMKSEVLT